MFTIDTMNKKITLYILLISFIVAATSFQAMAFNPNKYATQSRLATGKWVKIHILENGMYQITHEELAKMGFNNPSSVRIYGKGGHPINELLDGKAIDDLAQIPTLRTNNKICFYANGPVKYTLSTPTTVPHYTRVFNSYSSTGYYFITCDDGTQPLTPTKIIRGNTGTINKTTSIDYFHHEEEKSSPSQSGKDMLGEMINNGEITFNYSLNNLCGDSAIVVNPCAASKTSKAAFITASLNSNAISFTTGSSRIYGTSSEYVFYNFASPVATFRSTTQIPKNGTLTIGLNCPDGISNIKWARLDYFILTYYHHNTMLNAIDNQFRMGYNKLSAADCIVISDATDNTQVWNIDNPNSPQTFNLQYSEGRLSFMPNTSSTSTQFIVFDPSKELKSIDGYTEVENQNIHGLPTPDMVIVTCEELLPQAERVAQLHRDIDKMTVHVIDQQKIFNEFSSGTPDAMAIRLMNKMFYDRNSNKFKNLLMFGTGSYDNRHITAKRDYTILTYESVGSNDESTSYVSDDFFGFLDDNSGNNPAADLLKIGVGRIPCRTLTEAERDVDKLINYLKFPDYGEWRNNAVFIGDYVDSESSPYLHIYQAEGISNIITNESEAGLMSNKVYNSQFPKDPTSGFALEARKELTSLLSAGQFFMTYVGHAGPSAFTKSNKLWTSGQAKNVHYAHYPILTAACCDVARFDCDQEGIVEIMFHNPNGGAIAAVASTRSAYADGNDALNQAFVRAMFSYKSAGYFSTLGEAYMKCKQSFGKITNYNKMMFVLLGDPAIRVFYPKPEFKVTRINGRIPPDYGVASGAMQEITVEAKVYKANSTSVNTSFNGDATLAIYDYSKKQTNFQDRDIFYPNILLTKVTGRVVNGVFTAKAVIPRQIFSSGGSGLIKIYAHKDNSKDMVNGTYDKLVLRGYDPTNPLTITDNNPPVINAISINSEEDFATGKDIAGKCTLHVRATDDIAFNIQSHPIGNGMSVSLDGGKTSFPQVKSYATMSNESKMLNVELPMQLEEGEHTLEFTVYDAAGNKASRTISFVVGTTSQMEILVMEEPAINQATFMLDTPIALSSTVELKVLDSSDNVVWTTTTDSFPCTWDLKNRRGKRVKPGVYKFHGRYKTSNGAHGGTSIGHIIVADPI